MATEHTHSTHLPRQLAVHSIRFETLKQYATRGVHGGSVQIDG